VGSNGIRRVVTFTDSDAAAKPAVDARSLRAVMDTRLSERHQKEQRRTGQRRAQEHAKERQGGHHTVVCLHGRDARSGRRSPKRDHGEG
jgi:hypothetical protein